MTRLLHVRNITTAHTADRRYVTVATPEKTKDEARGAASKKNTAQTNDNGTFIRTARSARRRRARGAGSLPTQFCSTFGKAVRALRYIL